MDGAAGCARTRRGLPEVRPDAGGLRAALHPPRGAACGVRRRLRRRHPAVAPMSTVGEEMHALVERLYPLCRSITGDGVRATLEIVGEYVPLQVREVPTGTQVLDWTVPQEWNIRDAYVADSEGNRVV